MRRLLAGLISAFLLCCPGTGTAVAELGVDQPLGSVPIPDGPAQAWVIADMDSGAVLASKNGSGRYAQASTIKVLLAMVVLGRDRLILVVAAWFDAGLLEARGEARRALLWARKAKSEDPQLREATDFLRELGES